MGESSRRSLIIIIIIRTLLQAPDNDPGELVDQVDYNSRNCQGGRRFFCLIRKQSAICRFAVVGVGSFPRMVHLKKNQGPPPKKKKQEDEPNVFKASWLEVKHSLHFWWCNTRVKSTTFEKTLHHQKCNYKVIVLVQTRYTFKYVV